jgi:hypothetical protein
MPFSKPCCVFVLKFRPTNSPAHHDSYLFMLILYWMSIFGIAFNARISYLWIQNESVIAVIDWRVHVIFLPKA